MINFALKTEKGNENLDKIRRLVVTGTTIVLVLYLIGTAGFLGWGAYWSRREIRASAAFEQLSAEVGGFAEQEITVRKLADRLKEMQKFLDGRGDLIGLSQATTGENIRVIGWIYEGGKVKASVSSSDPQNVRTFTDSMMSKFSGVQLDSLVWGPTTGWVGNIGLKGLKKI